MLDILLKNITDYENKLSNGVNNPLQGCLLSTDKEMSTKLTRLWRVVYYFTTKCGEPARSSPIKPFSRFSRFKGKKI